MAKGNLKVWIMHFEIILDYLDERAENKLVYVVICYRINRKQTHRVFKWGEDSPRLISSYQGDVIEHKTGEESVSHCELLQAGFSMPPALSEHLEFLVSQKVQKGMGKTGTLIGSCSHDEREHQHTQYGAPTLESLYNTRSQCPKTRKLTPNQHWWRTEDGHRPLPPASSPTP